MTAETSDAAADLVRNEILRRYPSALNITIRVLPASDNVPAVPLVLDD